MTIEALTNAEVIDAEGKADMQFDLTPLPTLDLNTARWVVCAVNEDINRFALLKAVKTWHCRNARPDRARFVFQLDRSKYALRYALDLCAKRLPVTDACGPIPLNAANYESARYLLASAEEFAAATRAFSAHHAGTMALCVDRVTGLI